MQNKIQSFWFGKTLSQIEKLSMASFLANGHTFDIYTYDEITDLPSGVNQKDANQILPREKIFFDSAGGIASFSDWFRYKMLYENGGWWVDLDVICLKPFELEAEYCFATENYSTNYEIGVTNCVIKSPAGAEYLKMILDYIESFENYHDIDWGEFGPNLINTVLKQFDSGEFIMPTKAFCPVDWTEVGAIVHEQRELPEDAYAIHMWNNLWHLNSIDKNRTYDPESIYERLKMKYLT